MGGREQLLGLVFPGDDPDPAARVNGSAANAPDEAALMAPAPRATFPSHLTLASRTILGIRLLPAFARSGRASRARYAITSTRDFGPQLVLALRLLARA